MNKTIFMLLAVFINFQLISQPNFISEAEARKNPQTIVDYFLILPENALGSELKTFEARKKSLLPTADYKPVVDIKNAYIQTNDFVEFGGVVYSVCYFNKQDKQKVIAVSSFFEGGDGNYSTTKFYEYNKTLWKEVTNVVLPEISFEDFFKSNEKMPNVQFRKYQIFFTLPQKGTTVEARLVRDFNYYDETNGNEYHKLFDELEKRKLFLVWNKKKAVFEIAK